MNLLLFDHPEIRLSLLPLTYTRPIADLRFGILKIAEKWSHDLGTPHGFFTQDYLQGKFRLRQTNDNIYINGALCPDPNLVSAIKNLSPGEGLQQQGILLARRDGEISSIEQLVTERDNYTEYQQPVTLIKYNWELFLNNGAQIEQDFTRVTRDRESHPITDPFTVIYNKENVFVEEGVSIKAAIINAEDGPVYLGKNVEVQEGTIIQGPFGICEHSQLRLGGKMRFNTTIGPYCKIGGEVGNVIFQDSTNKAHEGFLGNSVIGSWCNLGADTNNSNLKNNYSNVRCWNYLEGDYIDSGLQFCGTIMGDHSKCSINTMLNTGTVVGVCANIHGAGFPKKFVPSFLWGGTQYSLEYDFLKACETMDKVMERRSLKFDDVERKIYESIFNLSAPYRQKELS